MHSRANAGSAPREIASSSALTYYPELRMRWSKSYLPTHKEVPKDAEIPSHQLMLRAGLIRMLGAGVYTFLPAGLRVLHRIERIVREEMNRVGGQELQMPVLHPGELYEETGRLANFGEILFTLNDRRQRLYALGPTHEEVVTDLARAELKSYRQLPQCLYQIQIKFRDEFRPRFGVIRAREFMMKDAYSFHATPASLVETYEAMAGAYARILERCGLNFVRVEAESGAIGGDVNHEFIVLADQGESVMFRCPNCGYAANDERAVSMGPAQPIVEAGSGPRDVATPGKHTVDNVSAFLGVSPQQLVKTLLFKSHDRLVAALVPGDRALNEVKFAKVAADAQLLDEAGVRSLTGAPVGFAGPVGLGEKVEIIADALLEGYPGMIVGANRADTHTRGVRMGRDFRKPDRIADISTVVAGDRCRQCQAGELAVQRGIEIGHIFNLDVKYSKSMNATFLDANGQEQHFIMGCYGFGVSRAVAAAIEQHHDERGIRWPKALAPFHAIVLPVNPSDPQSQAVAEALYQELVEAGLDVLLDDRDLRPGPRFKDADLVGVPLRVTIGERNLKDQNVEIYYRLEDRTEIVAVKGAGERVRAYYLPTGSSPSPTR
jgi:prolyl-tRNA synthetase